jgi:hypothetical protein
VESNPKVQSEIRKRKKVEFLYKTRLFDEIRSAGFQPCMHFHLSCLPQGKGEKWSRLPACRLGGACTVNRSDRCSHTCLSWALSTEERRPRWQGWSAAHWRGRASCSINTVAVALITFGLLSGCAPHPPIPMSSGTSQPQCLSAEKQNDSFIVYCNHCGVLAGKVTTCPGQLSHDFKSALSSAKIVCNHCGGVPGENPTTCPGHLSHAFQEFTN